MLNPQGTVGAAPAIVTGRNLPTEELHYVMSHIEASLAKREREGREEVWDESWDNYLVIPVGGRRFMFPRHGSPSVASYPYARGEYPNRSRMKDPESHQIAESIISQALGLLIGGTDFLSATPIGEDDYEKGRLLSRLLQAVIEQPGAYGTFYRLFKDAFIMGTSILQIGWQTLSRKQMTEMPVIINGMNLGTEFVADDVVYKNNVMLELVDRYDFYEDPNGTRIHQDMVGVAKRFTITEQQARQLAEAGTYDKAATFSVIADEKDRQGKSSGRGANYGSFQSGGRARFADGNAMDARPQALITGFEYWGNVPLNYANGETNRVITVLGGKVVRSHLNPFIDGNVPFVEIVANPIAGRFDGLSPLEVIRFLQDSADNMLMVLNDAADLAVRPSLLVGGGFGGDPDRIRARLFDDIIACADPDKVKPVPYDYNGLTLAAGEWMRRKQAAREASGATDTVQAIASSDRQTAFEVSELTRLASMRIDTMVRVIERDNMPYMGRMIHSRLRQFLPDAGAVAIMNGEAVRVSLAQINFEADVRFNGSRQALTKAQQGAAYRDFLALVGQAPESILVYPKIFTRLAKDVLGIVDAEQIIAEAIERANALRQQEMAMQIMAQQQAAASKASGGQGTGSTAKPSQPSPASQNRDRAPNQ